MASEREEAQVEPTEPDAEPDAEQEAEPEAEPPDEPGPEPSGFVCPECGAVEQSPLRLGLHKRRAHGIVGKSASSAKERRSRKTKTERKPLGERTRAPSRERSEGSQARRKRLVKETIIELLDVRDALRGQGTVDPDETLADVIRRDADRIASSLAFAAERFTALGRLIDRACGHGSALTFVRGFLGVGKHAIRKLRQARPERVDFLEEVAEWEPGQPLPGADVSRFEANGDEPAHHGPPTPGPDFVPGSEYT